MTDLSVQRLPDDVEVRLSLDTSPMPRQMCLEPWGMVLDLDPNADYLVVGLGPAPGAFETGVQDALTTVWAWPGSVAVVEREGVVVCSEALRVPPVPAGMSVSDFLHLVMGESNDQPA